MTAEEGVGTREVTKVGGLNTHGVRWTWGWELVGEQAEVRS